VDHAHFATRVLAYEQARREVEDWLRLEGTEPRDVDGVAPHAMANQHLNENRSRLVELIEAQYEPLLAELREISAMSDDAIICQRFGSKSVRAIARAQGTIVTG